MSLKFDQWDIISANMCLSQPEPLSSSGDACTCYSPSLSVMSVSAITDTLATQAIMYTSNKLFKS